LKSNDARNNNQRHKNKPEEFRWLSYQ